MSNRYRVSLIIITKPRSHPNDQGSVDEWIYVDTMEQAKKRAAEIEKNAPSQEFKRRVVIAQEIYTSQKSY